MVPEMAPATVCPERHAAWIHETLLPVDRDALPNRVVLVSSTSINNTVSCLTQNSVSPPSSCSRYASAFGHKSVGNLSSNELKGEFGSRNSSKQTSRNTSRSTSCTSNSLGSHGGVQTLVSNSLLYQK